jgi:hypothetical protein
MRQRLRRSLDQLTIRLIQREIRLEKVGESLLMQSINRPTVSIRLELRLLWTGLRLLLIRKVNLLSLWLQTAARPLIH